MKKFNFIIVLLIGSLSQSYAQREHLLMDFDWKFALGHVHDVRKDFNHTASHFTHWAKTGYGDGAASENFDDRAWRVLDLPHDWCVELPFSPKGTNSHGYKAIGHNFPENSIGWYRKTFFIPESDKGKKIKIQFDGIHRNASVFVNSFYVGTEQSGYASVEYDITDYLNYGDENTISVRVDASVEEGWFYEGAGIYRHVWLNKMEPLHVARYGTFITTDIASNSALIKTRTTIENETTETKRFEIVESIVDASGNIISSGIQKSLEVAPLSEKQFIKNYHIEKPTLWSLENPYLHKLLTVIKQGNKVVDSYTTTFGIRTVKFDAEKGFLLNEKPVKIKGVCNHQDHAGVGTAIPDALQEWRVLRVKEMGGNAIRTSHNPPTPELLDICDRLGVLIMDENRLMGSNKEHIDWMSNYIKRDRNHPCVFIWSLGNEEWHIEGNEKGQRIHMTMENIAHQLDSSRAFTTACSGGWDTGIGTVSEVMGINYIHHGDVDAHKKKFPHQPLIGTEESNIKSTRGIFETDDIKCHLAPTNKFTEEAEDGWKFYTDRSWASGLFYWTGFDYRGEPYPFGGFPAVASQFGINDLCGFPKSVYYYYQSMWQEKPVLHLQTHWNRDDFEKKEFNLIVFSNCEEVELFVNKKSLGKKKMPDRSHLEWPVTYRAGSIEAKGYKGGKLVITETIKTAGAPSSIVVSSDKTNLLANGEDLAIVGLEIVDKNGIPVPTAMNELKFSINGPGKIIGVGNGNPSSLEAEQYFETIQRVNITDLKELTVNSLEGRKEIAVGFDDSKWIPAFSNEPKDWTDYRDTLVVIRGSFTLPKLTPETIINLFTKSITEYMSLYINGKLIRANIVRDSKDQSFVLPHNLIKEGVNEYAITGKRFKKTTPWEQPNQDPGLVQVIYPAEQWKRNAFNGLAQVLIQADKKEGNITLKVTSEGLKTQEIIIQSQTTKLRPQVGE